GELLHIPVGKISPNPENPRLIFNQERLDALAESISEVGILVPLIVFQEDDGSYILLDGERTWQCAKRLNIKEVPANSIAKPSKIENILRMFNIHNVREDWELMPTALKLGQIIEVLNLTNERRLSELTSLPISTIRRCKVLLSLSQKYQKALLAGEFKPDFFIEMEGVLRKIEDNIPTLFSKYGRNGLVDLFVEMHKKGMIKAVTDFRLFKKVLDAGKLGLDHSALEDLVERVLVKQEIDFQDSYEIVEDLISLSQLQRKVTRFSETLRSIHYDNMKPPEKDQIRSTLTELRDTIDAILQSL
ncbi:ParB/RepB/Spo0J family partition protein, partial [bacterium]|nr:ParB/RepB/Spo0J family partition protein [bacterium]